MKRCVYTVSWSTEEGGIRWAKRCRENVAKKTSPELTFMLGFKGALGYRKDRSYLSGSNSFSQNLFGFSPASARRVTSPMSAALPPSQSEWAWKCHISEAPATEIIKRAL